MDFTVQTQSLSALNPIKFAYKYNSHETLDSTTDCFKSNFELHQYKMFEGFRDAALSRQNCVVLTNTKALSSIFSKKLDFLTADTIAATIYLKDPVSRYFTRSSDNIYAGGSGTKIALTISPVEDNLVELFVDDKLSFVRIDEQYPYTVRISQIPLVTEKKHLQRFQVEVINNQISFKILTDEGYRYLSYGSDRILRAIGLEMNDTIVNPYRFEFELLTNSRMYHNFDPTVREVKYIPDSGLYSSVPIVDIQNTTVNDTHLLITCSTVELSKPELSSTNVNIAIAKTNFSSAGSFTPSI